MMIYMIVFSETAAQLIGGFFNQSLGDVWYSSKLVYVIGLGVCLGPVVVKKELAELEWLSIFLGISIMIFMLLSFNLLVFDKRYVAPS